MTQEELLRLPKVELHCHLDGSLSQEFIEKRLEEKYAHISTEQLLLLCED